MKVTVDREECTSCSICWEDCPGLFEQNPDDDWSQIVPAHRESGDPAKGIVPVDLQECAQEAADSCPVAIIHVEK